ncbi:MAG: hypothetical protein ACYTFH_09810 [Planctomycetota bacterium]|jgi:hypothetical protein
MSARAASRSGGAAILWGLFAASSWAWCIGLFLPVVLRRLMGWPGFAAFAIPNVLGCAAFGFVLDRRRSRRLVRDHRGAMALFGAVTIAYQLLLAGWTGRIAIGDSLTPALGDAGAWAGAGIGLLAVLVVGLAVAMARDRAIAWIAAAAWGFSAIALAAAWWIRPPAAGLDAAAFAPELAPTEVWWLLPTLLLGFLLCPYLDLTFHRVATRSAAADLRDLRRHLRRTDRAGRPARRSRGVRGDRHRHDPAADPPRPALGAAGLHQRRSRP